MDGKKNYREICQEVIERDKKLEAEKHKCPFCGCLDTKPVSKKQIDSALFGFLVTYNCPNCKQLYATFERNDLVQHE